MKYTIDCTQPADDTIIKVEELEKFLKERIKVDGKTGNLTDRVNHGFGICFCKWGPCRGVRPQVRHTCIS